MVALFVSFAACLPASAESADPAAEDLERLRVLEEKCLDCHDDPMLEGGGRSGRRKSVFVDPARYRASAHYRKDMTCFSCHPDSKLEFHQRCGVAIRKCWDCHDHGDEHEQFKSSLHGKALARGAENAADCGNCHGNHYIAGKSDPAFEMSPENAAETCVKCHPGKAGASSAATWLASRRLSAHGKADLSEEYSERRCTLCHFGSHTHKTPDSTPLCGQCHAASYSATGGPAGDVHWKGGRGGAWLGLARGTGFAAAAIAALLLVVPFMPAAARFFAGPGRGAAGKPDGRTQARGEAAPPADGLKNG